MFIQKDWTISVENKKTKEVYHHLNAFVEKGDDGDEYNYSPCGNDKEISIYHNQPTITCIESSDIEVKYRIEYNAKVPAKVVNHERVQELEALKIISDVSLKARSQTIDFTTTIENHSCLLQEDDMEKEYALEQMAVVWKIQDS